MKNSILLACVVTGEYFTDINTFYENIGDNYEQLKKQVEKSKTIDDIRKIVKQYI